MLFLPLGVLAQGGPDDDPPPFPDDTTDVPFDGGVSLLLAAGVGYGLKKVHIERKKRSKP